MSGFVQEDNFGLPMPATEEQYRAAALRGQQLDPRLRAQMMAANPQIAQGARATVAAMQQGVQQEQGNLGTQFTQALQRAQEHRQRAFGSADINLRQQALDADAWGYGQDQTGGGFLFNKKTGQIQPLNPAGFQPAGSQLPFSGKMNEGQMKMGGNIGTAADAVQTALTVGYPADKEDLVGSLGQTLGQGASRLGVPALASKAAEQSYAAWFQVISPVVHARTGAQMSVQELEREAAALMPRPGESRETHLMKSHQLISLLRKYTIGLPPQVQMAIFEDLDKAQLMLPRTVAEYQQMRANGGGSVPFEPNNAHPPRPRPAGGAGVRQPAPQPPPVPTAQPVNTAYGPAPQLPVQRPVPPPTMGRTGAQPAAPAPAPAAPPQVEARKSINGKSYVKVGGRWYEE